jgi:chloramphenicol-sensitive protein RarD
MTLNKGIVMAVASYCAWGLFPLYLKSIDNVAPTEVLMHRIVWAVPFLLLILASRAQWSWVYPIFKQPRVIGGFLVSALFLSSNWFIYIWAVNHDRVIDASLGYFINPIFNVLLGFVLLKERLRPLQWLAVGIAAAGVLWLAIQSNHIPWISLALGATFGIYGFLRKTAALGTLEGLTLETMMLLPFAVGYLIYLHTLGESTFFNALSNGNNATPGLLVAAGPITAIPLLLFAAGARLIPMSTLGLLQYVNPTLQFLLGIWVFHEPFGKVQFIGFMIIWGALMLYSLEGLWRSKSMRQSQGVCGGKT